MFSNYESIDFDSERGSEKMQGIREDDHANGIYWCELGADVGLLKRAKFKKKKG